LFHHHTYSKVASSTCSIVRHGPRQSDELGLVEPIDGLGERVIEGVPDGSRGWLRAELADAVGVDDREVVRPVVGVVDQAREVDRALALGFPGGHVEGL